MEKRYLSVIPAESGDPRAWVPAYAGMALCRIPVAVETLRRDEFDQPCHCAWRWSVGGGQSQRKNQPALVSRPVIFR